MPSELLTIKEVASRLKCHPHTIRRWIWNKTLEAVKVGDLVRIQESKLEKFIHRPHKPKGKARKIKDGSKTDSRGSAVALLKTMKKLGKNINPAEVEELEELITAAEQPVDWSNPLA